MSKAVVTAGWDDVPHITQAERERLLAATPPYLRDARSKGIPRLGAGAIYPFDEAFITVTDFPIPAHWPMGYGFDVGWKATAALTLAWDRDLDIIYAIREYKRGEAEPAVHAEAIRRQDPELYGASDPAARGRSQRDGTKLFDEYLSLGLRLVLAENTVETGLFEVHQRFSEGRLKLFASCAKTLAELRLYHRDEKGRVVKENDHLMDCLRYAVATRDKVLTWREGQPALRVIRANT